MLAEPYQVYPEDGNEEPRAIEPSDIAVLIRSRTHLKTYERALDDVGIPYAVASGSGFYETPEITALCNLFSALADPSDERALYGVLRSPLFGFTDDTLARATIDEPSLWAGLEATDTAELRAAYELLVSWRAAAGVTGESGRVDSWAALVTRIVNDTGFLASVSAGDRPRQAVANVEKFRQQLRTRNETRSLPTVVSRIERHRELSRRQSEATTTDDGVQILTIHDAKGMEFPCVVVPGISRTFKDEAAIGRGAVEFERIGDQHAVGVKTPSPEDPFERTDTIARATLRDRRRREERAEEKRTLYVACTRARDHLLLSGTHELADDGDELTLGNLADADPDEPSAWRDWVQPALLPSELTSRLDNAAAVSRSVGDRVYTVSIPARSVPIESAGGAAPAVETSPTPQAPPAEFSLSATNLAGLFGGYGRLELADDGRSIGYVEEARTPDARHGTEDEGDPSVTASGEEASPTAGDADDDTTPTADDIDEISPAVFGELVHRICELRPPDDWWATVMEQTLASEDADVELTDDRRERVRRHAEAELTVRDELTAGVAVEGKSDELYVSASFERGEIAGRIDHLTVGADRCHVVDYKTGAVTPATMEADADYYMTQLKAYAVALHQQYPDKAVTASLVFTEISDNSTKEWSPKALARIEDEIRTRLSSQYLPTDTPSFDPNDPPRRLSRASSHDRIVHPPGRGLGSTPSTDRHTVGSVPTTAAPVGDHRRTEACAFHRRRRVPPPDHRARQRESTLRPGGSERLRCGE